MKAESPCFSWWLKDYMSDGNTRAMSLAARGAYIELINLCWIDGSVPSDADRLARIWGVDLETAEGLRTEIEIALRKANDRLTRDLPQTDLDGFLNTTSLMDRLP